MVVVAKQAKKKSSLVQCWRAKRLLPEGRRFDLHTVVAYIRSCEKSTFCRHVKKIALRAGEEVNIIK